MESIPTYSTIVIKTASMLDEMISNFTELGYNAMATYLTKPIGLLCILYIVLTGYAIALGFSDKPANEFKKIVLRIGLVFMFALNWGNFSAYAVALFTSASMDIGAAVMKVLPINIPNLTDAIGLNGSLQTLFIEFSRVGQWVMSQGSLTNPGPLFTGIGMMGFGVVVVIVAFFEIYVAKILMAVCFCVAPLFIALTLFDKTRVFFDRWLGTVVGSSLVFIFVSAVLGICLQLMHFTVAEHYLSRAVNVTFTDWLPTAFMSVLCVKVLFDVAGVAKGIGSACHTSGSSALVGGMVGAAMGASRKGGSATKETMKKGLKGLAALTPKGAIAQMGMAAAQKMTQGGSSAIQGIQNRMRSGRVLNRKFRGE